MKSKHSDSGYRMNISIIAMCVLAFLFAPIEMFLMIKEDTWFSASDIIGYLAIFFIAAVVAGVVADILMQRLIPKIWNRVVFILFCLALAFYIQGNFIKSDYGVLNGKEIDWSLYRTDGYISIALFSVLLAVGIYLVIRFDIEKIRRVENIIAVCMVLLMAQTLLVASIRYGGFDHKTETICTTKGEWDYSRNENFVIIVLDSFDSRMLESLLNSEHAEEIRTKLSDFVFCDNTVSLYAMTDYSLLQILTGKEYLCEKGYDEFCDDAYAGSFLLKELESRDYNVGIYAANAIASDTKYAKNWYRVRYGVDSHSKLLMYMYRFVGFRYLPFHLKKFCWFYPDEMEPLKVIHYMDDDGEEVSQIPFDWANYIFNDELKNIKSNEEKKCFYLYHLKGTHPIRDYTRDFVHSDEEVDFEEVAMGCIDMLGRYMEKLKQEGVYDNTTVLVMADHGESLYGNEENGYRNSPLLLYKGANEHGGFEISDEPCTFENFDKLYEKILKENVTNGEAVNILSKDQRYTYNIIWADHSTIAHSSVGGFQKIMLNGRSSDVNAYSPTDEKHLLE